jgi:hypothetical protein
MIHEFRHTLGTLTGRNFASGMAQAVMGRRSRKSAEQYFHPIEDMAAEAREKLSQNYHGDSVKRGKRQTGNDTPDNKNGRCTVSI